MSAETVIGGHKVFVFELNGFPWLEMIADTNPPVRMKIVLGAEEAIGIGQSLIESAEACIAAEQARYGESDFNLAACDYYQGVGTCTFGCYDEPACITECPLEGWPDLGWHPMKHANLRAVRLGRNVTKWLSWGRAFGFRHEGSNADL